MLRRVGSRSSSKTLAACEQILPGDNSGYLLVRLLALRAWPEAWNGYEQACDLDLVTSMSLSADAFEHVRALTGDSRPPCSGSDRATGVDPDAMLASVPKIAPGAIEPLASSTALTPGCAARGAPAADLGDPSGPATRKAGGGRRSCGRRCREAGARAPAERPAPFDDPDARRLRAEARRARGRRRCMGTGCWPEARSGRWSP